MAARFPAWPVSRRFNTLDALAYARAPMVTPHSNEAYLQHATLSFNCPSNEFNQPLSPHGSQKVVTPSDKNKYDIESICTLPRGLVPVVVTWVGGSRSYQQQLGRCVQDRGHLCRGTINRVIPARHKNKFNLEGGQ